jgi:hypothetical protein
LKRGVCCPEFVTLLVFHPPGVVKFSRICITPLRDGASDFELFFTHIVCLTAHRLVQLGNIPAVFDSGIKQKMNDTL